ncbi:MAG: AMP-binding protein, partial [Vitreimonas sp.]
IHPERIAIADGHESLSYGALDERTQRLAGLLRERGVGSGDRIAILSENRREYLELFLGAARIGAVVACQNWRLAEPELRHCLDLVEPRVVFVSPRHAPKLEALGRTGLMFGDAYEAALSTATPEAALSELDPEAPLLILYTSGTTGLPKGALISHRAEIARNLVVHAEFGLAAGDSFVAWSPLYHMGGAEFSLGTLMSGGKVIVVDGFDAARLVEIVAGEQLGWLIRRSC